MDQSTIFLIAVISVVVNAAVSYVIIAAATMSHRRAKYEWAQMELLGKMAIRQGVPVEEVTKTYRDAGLIS